MSKKTIIILSLLLMLSTLPVLPASAKKGQYYIARGTIDSYVDAWSAEVKQGWWSVRVIEGNIEYSGFYQERNLAEYPENSPVGSIDFFWQTFTVEGYTLDGDELEFWGTLHIKKLWCKLDGTREILTWDTYPVKITIDSDSYFLDSPPEGPGPDPIYNEDWDRTGTTRSIRYSE